MARRGYSLLKRIAASTVKRSNTAPGFVIVEAIERVASSDAGLATAATVEIHFERVLFSRAGRSEWNQRTMRLRADFRVSFVPASEPFHCGQIPLLLQKRVNQCARFVS
jgi:hypothetical protein